MTDLAQSPPVEKPHKYPRKQRETPEQKAARKEANRLEHREYFRGLIDRTALEEAKTVLATVIEQQGGELAIPDLRRAHSIIYERLELAWVDAIGGNYLVVQAKLAVIKALGHYLGVDAAIKLGAKQGRAVSTGETDAETVKLAKHLKDLGLVVAAHDSDPGQSTPRVTIDLDASVPGGGVRPTLGGSK